MMDAEIPTRHVKGRQDLERKDKNHKYNNATTPNLSLETKLNIEADLLATRAWQRHFRHQEFVYYPAAQCSFFINNAAVTKNYRSYM
jgi:hypothetical protein